MRNALWVGLLVLGAAQGAQAQVNVSVGTEEVRIGADGSVNVKGSGGKVQVGAGGQIGSQLSSVGGGNEVSSTVGGIAPGANIEGVTIINGRLWIDGKEIPPGVKSYKSPKTGKTYKIERHGKNVAVTGGD